MNVTCVSVLICTCNRANLLRETLAAVSATTPPDDCDVEIIVVDNNSTDSTPRVIADAARRSPFPIVSLQEKKQGKSYALNRGLDAAKGDIIALTDDDVWPDVNWVRNIVNRFREHDVTFVFGRFSPVGAYSLRPACSHRPRRPSGDRSPSSTTATNRRHTRRRALANAYRLARTWRSETRS